MGIKNWLIYIFNNKSLDNAYQDFVKYKENRRSYKRNTKIL